MSEFDAPKTKTDISAIFGILHRPGERAVTIEEIDDAIVKAVAEDDDRIRREWAKAHPKRGA